MIVSASRRTDIPAFYGEWLLHRLQEGYVLVRNPFNSRQVARVSLDPQVVDCLVFWTKNPAPLLPLLDAIDRLGHRYYFHYTVTGYDRSLERSLPAKSERLAVFRRLADRIGPERVLWRFDPILFTREQGPAAVLREYAKLARALHPYTRQCTISFLSLYRKCSRNLQGVDLLSLDDSEKIAFVDQLAALAGQNNISLKSCCDTFLHERCGIETAQCIDGRLVAELLGQPVRIAKDKGQRPGCGCVSSVDIGAYDTCAHGCRYCYAISSDRAVTANLRGHDTRSPLLTGVLTDRDVVTEKTIVSFRSQQALLF